MAIDDTGFDDLDDPLIPKDSYCAPGTFWVIREPVHGEVVNGIVSMDLEGIKDFAKSGEVYCANCDSWTEHNNTSTAKLCPPCSAPYKAKDWFPEKLYSVEVNGQVNGESKPYQDAVDYAQTIRNTTNVIIVSAVKK